MDSTRSPNDPSAYLESLMQAGQQSFKQFDDAMAAAMGLADKQAEAQTSPFVAAANLQRDAVLQFWKFWNTTLVKALGVESNVEPGKGDRRFKDTAWAATPYYDLLKQSYLLGSKQLTDFVEQAQVDERTKLQLKFYARQFIDAMSPSNFPATNPEVIRTAIQTRAASLAAGMQNLIEDVQKGRITRVDESRFEVGGNLANTPGSVIYENELIQLIQYTPVTAEVEKTPLLIVPPCINKYYILDLRPENSFVRYAVGEGHTVFMVSWRNVGPAQGQFGWDDYLRLGIFEPFRVAREICGADRVNALGFCVGGTLLGAALAVLSAKGEDAVESVTYLTTMLDFAEPGQIGVFVDEPGVAAREAAIGQGGIFPGAALDAVFSSLRANDLIWPYVVSNYLLGDSPAAFDLLYWNADSTNLPGPMYCYYVRNTYLENKLRVPGALVNCGVPVDLGRIDRPSFIYSSREDHIVPWRAAYRSLALLGGEKRFVLGASGHIAGVINPPAKKRRSYWTGEPQVRDPEAWLAGAAESPGSWWPQWSQWLEAFKGGRRKAPGRPGSTRYRAIEPAPGRYVKQKATQES